MGIGRRLSVALALLLAGVVLLAGPVSAGDVTVTFDDLSLAPNSYWNGPDPNGTTVQGPYGPQVVGSFTSGNTSFANVYDQTFGSWSGFAYSNMTDATTPGFGNQFSTYAGAAMAPGSNFGVASGYAALEPNLIDPNPFDPTSKADLLGLPHFTIPTSTGILGMYVTNTTYAALSMLYGDSFAKKFGGPTGNDPDWLKLSAYGIDANGNVLSNSVDFYLADYRFADNSLDYIVKDWTFMDLSSLSGATTLCFNVSSSDVGDFGMNTPATWAVDNIMYETAAIPEPSSLALAGIGAFVSGLSLLARRRRA